MRQYALSYYYLFYLITGGRLYLPCVFVEANGNVFLRGVETHAQTVESKADTQAVNCPGIRSLGVFPVITGGTTSITQQQSRASASSTRSILDDGSIGFSQEVLYKCSEDPKVLAAPGVWYSLVGTDTSIHASLLIENVSDQKIAIFEATDGCEPSQCLMVSNSFDKKLDWFAESDKTYFIKVFATSPVQSGPFILRMEEFSSPRPSNDMCETAQTLQRGTVTRDASFEAWPHGLSNTECNLDAHSRGLFYTLEGTGGVITVTLAPSISEGRLGLVILAGDDCGICVRHSQFVTAIDSKQIISVPTQFGEVYHILVSGEDIGDAGSFKLSVA